MNILAVVRVSTVKIARSAPPFSSVDTEQTWRLLVQAIDYCVYGRGKVGNAKHSGTAMADSDMSHPETILSHGNIPLLKSTSTMNH